MRHLPVWRVALEMKLDPAEIDRRWTLSMVADANDLLDAMAEAREKAKK